MSIGLPFLFGMGKDDPDGKGGFLEEWWAQQPIIGWGETDAEEGARLEMQRWGDVYGEERDQIGDTYGRMIGNSLGMMGPYGEALQEVYGPAAPTLDSAIEGAQADPFRPVHREDFMPEEDTAPTAPESPASDYSSYTAPHLQIPSDWDEQAREQARNGDRGGR